MAKCGANQGKSFSWRRTVALCQSSLRWASQIPGRQGKVYFATRNQARLYRAAPSWAARRTEWQDKVFTAGQCRSGRSSTRLSLTPRRKARFSWRVEARPGAFRQDAAPLGVTEQRKVFMARFGFARPGSAWYSNARHRGVRQGFLGASVLVNT